MARELISVVRLRWLCMKCGVEKATLKKERLTLYFISNPDSIYYQSDNFNNMLIYAMNHPQTTEFKEDGAKRYMTVRHVQTIADALHCLQQLTVRTINQSD